MADIKLNTDNYAKFRIIGALRLDKNFVNHEVASLNIASNNINGFGKIINYGSMVSTSPSTLTTKIEIVNFGLVDMTTNDYWDQSGYPYTQYYGETHFNRFITENITHNGGGFHSSGSLTASGYSFNEGTIFPGGRCFEY